MPHDEHPSMPIQSMTPGRIVLYHGTSHYYEGPPTLGGKDVLKTGYPSMASDPYMAEYFAGGARDSRIYAIEVPTERILDLSDESDKWVRRKNLAPLRKQIDAAAASGKYDAVMLHDMTFGDEDGVEFRLLRKPEDSEWQVAPTSEHVENYREFDDVTGRLERGQYITRAERERMAEFLEEEIEYGNASEDMIDVLKDLHAEGRMGAEAITLAEERARQNQALLEKLREDPHSGIGMSARMDGLRASLARMPGAYARTREHGRETPSSTHSYQYSGRPVQSRATGRGRLR